jgi:hypothetical protein
VATEPGPALDRRQASRQAPRRAWLGAALAASCAVHAAAVTLLVLPAAGEGDRFGMFLEQRSPLASLQPQRLQVRLSAAPAQVDVAGLPLPVDSVKSAQFDLPGPDAALAAEKSAHLVVMGRAIPARAARSAHDTQPPAAPPAPAVPGDAMPPSAASGTVTTPTDALSTDEFPRRYLPADALDVGPVPASEPDLAPVAAAFRLAAPVRVRIYVSAFGPPDRVEFRSPAAAALESALRQALLATTFLPGRLAGRDAAAYIDLEFSAELLVAGAAVPVTSLAR